MTITNIIVHIAGVQTLSIPHLLFSILQFDPPKDEEYFGLPTIRELFTPSDVSTTVRGFTSEVIIHRRSSTLCFLHPRMVKLYINQIPKFCILHSAFWILNS